MNLFTQIAKLIPFNSNQQPIKPAQPPLDKCSAIVACIALNTIFSFVADKAINYLNHDEKSENNISLRDPEDPVLEKNKYTNSGLYLACMLIVNIVVISKFFSISPAKPSLIAASVLTVGRHVYRDWCQKNTLKDANIYGL
ncbi:MAG: hypothetical protein Q8K60_01380 [Parachlamydiaceae bacterium]|nr:hypothetical protein [Parachlamydiaceae bacterium]